MLALKMIAFVISDKKEYILKYNRYYKWKDIYFSIFVFLKVIFTKYEIREYVFLC